MKPETILRPRHYRQFINRSWLSLVLIDSHGQIRLEDGTVIYTRRFTWRLVVCRHVFGFYRERINAIADPGTYSIAV
jgi:hypothetical protein